MPGAFGPLRKFKFRVQLRGASSKKPRRVSLVAQRKILARGRVVTAGTEVKSVGAGQLNTLISKPRVKKK